VFSVCLVCVCVYECMIIGMSLDLDSELDSALDEIALLRLRLNDQRSFEICFFSFSVHQLH
jgi:hypothetical protein